MQYKKYVNWYIVRMRQSHSQNNAVAQLYFAKKVIICLLYLIFLYLPKSLKYIKPPKNHHC